MRHFGNPGSQERPLYEEEARERQLAAQNNNAGRAVREKIPQLENGKARDQAGEAVGVSGKYVDYARQLREEAPGLTAPGKTLHQIFDEANGNGRAPLLTAGAVD